MELAKLINSIDANAQAAQTMATPKEPLSQIKPSAVRGDNGTMSVKELRKQSWLKK
jgi:hypothetical protein